MSTNIVGQRIKQERTRANMSQAQLAALVGLNDKSQVVRIEKGTRKVDSTLLRMFADQFGVPMDSFFDESRLAVLAHARQGGSGDAEVDRMAQWGLDLLADIRFAEEEALRRGW